MICKLVADFRAKIGARDAEKWKRILVDSGHNGNQEAGAELVLLCKNAQIPPGEVRGLDRCISETWTKISSAPNPRSDSNLVPLRSEEVD